MRRSRPEVRTYNQKRLQVFIGHIVELLDSQAPSRFSADVSHVLVKMGGHCRALTNNGANRIAACANLQCRSLGYIIKVSFWECWLVSYPTGKNRPII